MDRAEVRQESHVVELIGDDSKALVLHEIESGLRAQITSTQKRLDLLGDGGALQNLFEVISFADLLRVCLVVAVFDDSSTDYR